MKIFAAQAVVALALISSPLSAHAGDDWHPIVFVNMTPDAKTTSASKACVAEMKKVHSEDDGPIKKLGETKTRALVGMPKGGPPVSRWPGSIFDRKKWDAEGPFAHDKNGDEMRVVVLVDCRPEEGYFDSLVISYPYDTSETRAFRKAVALRGVTWTKKLQTAIARRYY